MTAYQNNSLNLTKLEQSILYEYKRLSYGEQTKIFNLPEISYAKIPNNIPQHLRNNANNSIILQNCSSFETITFALMEQIFTCPTQEKKKIIDKIRISICDPNFLFGSSTIKGLLIKGLKKMNNHANDMKKPIANYLRGDQSLTAFSQFWKEVIEQQSHGEVQTFSEGPKLQYFQHISNYLGIDFELIWQREGKYETIKTNKRQILDSKNSCRIIINTKGKDRQQVSSSQQIEYVILLCQKRRSIIQQLWIVQPEPIPAGLSEQFNLLKARSWEVKQKGCQLARQFRQFYNLIKDV